MSDDSIFHENRKYTLKCPTGTMNCTVYVGAYYWRGVYLIAQECSVGAMAWTGGDAAYKAIEHIASEVYKIKTRIVDDDVEHRASAIRRAVPDADRIFAEFERVMRVLNVEPTLTGLDP